MNKFKPEQIAKSRKEALDKIKEFLNNDNVDEQFKDKSGGYYSEDKFIVTWIGYWNKMPSEFAIDKTDAFYRNYSGYSAIYVTRSLIHEKQISGYSTIERALIDVGLKLCSNRNEKVDFFKKYVEPYNERLKTAQLKNTTL